jgi:hypothetical protein
MLHWAVSAAVISALTLVVWLCIAWRVSDPVANAPLALMTVSALVVVGFGILALARRARTARALREDLADVQPAVDAYIGELMPIYERALGQIRDAVKTIDVPDTVDPKVRKRLTNHRDGILGVLQGRGLYQGRVPLGGGPYPVLGRSKRATAAS